MEFLGVFNLASVVYHLRPGQLVSDFRFQISDSRFQIPDFRFQISDFRFQIPDFRFPGFGFHISDFRIKISDFGFQISDFRFQISDIRAGGTWEPGEPGSRELGEPEIARGCTSPLGKNKYLCG